MAEENGYWSAGMPTFGAYPVRAKRLDAQEFSEQAERVYGGPCPVLPIEFDPQTGTQKVRVPKATHRVRFEDETEDAVTVVIEAK